MPTFEDALPALFGSLRPDKSKLLSDAALSAKEAEQKWPLLRSASPKGREQLPPLSSEERQNWSATTSAVKHEAPKPALSVPGMGEKMARGLEKLSSKKTKSVASANIGAQAETQPMDVSSSASTAQVMAPKSRKVPTPPPVDPSQVPFTQANPLTANSVPVPASKPALTSTTLEQPKQATGEESLAQVFSRLEKRSKPPQKPPAKPTSFLGRLGKR